MTDELPTPIARYFSATTPSQIADCFTDEGVVTDERRTYRGRRDILRWREEVGQISFRQDVLALGSRGDLAVVTCRVSGDFPGSPVELDHTFELVGDKIARLTIA
ncbi:nuclear transport factor 2 family protein [Methyloceanibacter sp. wino2]|uniref:nuclear transport factor 2 family protein n=1 Tax=Methyloceanibacter sp. wino2 TaxID=2170729 RepID=UPI00131EEA72|nr:nuclear transport factor 2 family protein [Methyloceanibacter sp. wino2]